jgi:hypothetical protein
MLHVLNGDCTEELLRAADIPGTLAVWADLLHEGPVRRNVGSADWKRERALYHSKAGYADATDVLTNYRDWDAELEKWAEHDEVVLWLEHDLFDQLLLMRHLTWFSGRGVPLDKLSLICIGEFPGVRDFHGLGELSSEQLTTLLPTRQRVTAGQVAAARRAWDAFTATEPGDLEQFVQVESAGLPFLVPALRRMLAEYPSTYNGLSLSEQHALEALATGRRLDVGTLMRALHRHERFFYMPDGSVANMMHELAGGDDALVMVEGTDPRPTPDDRFAITELGRSVLSGTADAIALRGIDRWIGGVHLHSPENIWRREQSGAIVRSVVI